MRLRDPARLLPDLQGIAQGWPLDIRPAHPDAMPFYAISARQGEPNLWCDCLVEDRPARWFDPVNTICDAVSAMALAVPAERPELICLHAAGVAMAMAGFPVFSDDVVPVFVTADAQAHGLAMGISPRLRLPLPMSLGAEFHRWVGRVAGPANAQYQYLRVGTQAPHGATLPVGAFVILDRQDAPVVARLDRVPPDAAMDALLYLNFTRDRHSGDILRVMAAMLTERPVFQLTYSDRAGAVSCLKAAFSVWPGDKWPDRPGPAVPFRLAEGHLPVQPDFGTAARLGQKPGTTATTLGATLYLADADGHAIYRMDPLAAAI